MLLLGVTRVRLCFRIIDVVGKYENISCLSLRASLMSSRGLKIYTKTGDKGKTGTFSGERRPKDDELFEALGTIDELSSALGVVMEFAEESKHNGIVDKLETIQCKLQDVASHVATPKSSATESKLVRTSFDESSTKELESWIDHLSEELPPLTSFILPSGGKTSSMLHMSRSICRRAERRIVPLYRNDQIDQPALTYVNRLSDFLFTAARAAAQQEGKAEKIYR